MIDPKQENKVTDFTEERISVLNTTIGNLERDMLDARAEIIKWNRLADDCSRDCSITLAMLQHFVTIAIERGNNDMIRDAIEYAHDDTGLEYSVIAEAVDRMGICDAGEYCQREYEVTVTIPVTVTVNAFDAQEAEQKACDKIDNCICDYQMTYDAHYDGECYVEEV